MTKIFKGTIVASECPLAAEQIKHGSQYDASTKHPIEILAQAYQLQ
jgi:Fe-S oxidoreductase